MNRLSLVLIALTLCAGIAYGFYPEPIVTKSMVLEKFGMPPGHCKGRSGNESFTYYLDDGHAVWFFFKGEQLASIGKHPAKFEVVGPDSIPANGIASYRTKVPLEKTMEQYRKSKEEFEEWIKTRPSIDDSLIRPVSNSIAPGEVRPSEQADIQDTFDNTEDSSSKTAFSTEGDATSVFGITTLAPITPRQAGF